MEDPKKQYGRLDWPPKVSVERENIVEGNFDFEDPRVIDAKREIREKYEEGC